MTVGKRVFDLVFATLALLLLWPVLLLVAAAILLADGRPVLFRQERVGRGGRPFWMLKFRTMRAAPSVLPPLTVGEDPRVTSVGRWLRRYKLDELPQLANVLRGEMTLVGPRPEVPRYVAHYSDEQRRVLDYVPGITDPASIGGWNESDALARWADPERAYLMEIMPRKIAAQLAYCRRMSRWSDLAVAMRTIGALIAAAASAARARLLRQRAAAILLVYVAVILVSSWAAYALRFDFAIPRVELDRWQRTLPALLAIRLVVYAYYRLYRGYWRHFGVADLLNLVKAVTVSSALFAALMWLQDELPGMPRSVIILDWAGTIFLASGAHFLARTLRERSAHGRSTGPRAFVIGAGDCAERLLRELEHNRSLELRVLGLIAESPPENGRSIHQVSVIGRLEDLTTLAARYQAELLVLALDAPTGRRMQRVVDACLATGLEVKTVPQRATLVDAAGGRPELRRVELQDLLGREQVSLDLGPVAADLQGRVVAITGAAGSIGSEIARQVARFGPRRLLLVDRAESPLYMIDLELRAAHPTLRPEPLIADVTDEVRMQRIFNEVRPDYVVHAAAYKHVPLMEDNVLEAARNNIVGTLVVAAAAAEAGAGKFVLISTDKAVNPSSVMGATKRVAERVVLGLPALCGAATEFRAVRFGNVLGSNGSVIPVFERQLAAGGPIQVTHPDVQRYFMTVQEAVELVLQAAAVPGAAGRVSMLDMGRPMRILDMAERMIRLAGLEPNRDVQIVFTGLRAGEKLQEELVSDIDAVVTAENEKIRIVQVAEADGAGIEVGLARLMTQLALHDADAVLEEIRRLVPECVPPLRGRPPAQLKQASRAEPAVTA
jgi:FlaA1/EpsC-like NDP-sugar epimerase/lipopolysaccharide/colanic/teichoic acid biosynthesis glycosyltransferase